MNNFPFYLPASFSVSELTSHIRELLESDDFLQDIWVEGEISNLSRPTSGHVYFTLKDGSASLRCVIWRSTAMRLNFRWQDGMAVQLHGSIGVYEASGQYQLYVDQARAAGEGILYMEFLRMKARLEAEGLFAEERKRPIPSWPCRVGIVTSPTGAALQDMLNVLRQRFPLCEVIVAPTPVQGNDAPLQIAAALEAINRLARPDVILLARGGGSIEDLWCFNSEQVAYAIVASQAPVITGIGHETDFTIADFAADLRAPTPTGAAVLATPDRAEIRSALMEQITALADAFEGNLEHHRWRFQDARGRLQYCSPIGRIQQWNQRLDESVHRMDQAVGHHLRLQEAHLARLQTHLNALDPTAILGRGYAIVTRRVDGQILKSTGQVQIGEEIDVRLSDGGLSAQVNRKD